MAPRRFLLYLVVIVVAVAAAPPTAGVDIDSEREKLEENRGQQDKTKAELEQARITDEQLAAALDTANRKVAGQQAVVDAAAQRVKDAIFRVTQTEAKITETQATIVERTREVESRAVRAYKNSDGHSIDAIFGARDVNQAVNRAEMLQKLFVRDREILERLRVLRSDLEELKRELEAARAAAERAKVDADEELVRLEGLRVEAARAKAAVDARIAHLDAELRALQAEDARIQAAIKKFEEEEAARQRAALAAAGTPGGDFFVGNPSQAGFVSPTSGILTSPFGMRWGRLHAGIDIANSVGTPIVAAKGGVVIAAERYGGYGNAVLLSHGGGLATLYGHMSSLAVRGGQSVGQGQFLGAMGSTGNSTGPHLHFEIRVNGNPVNPLPFLP